MSPKVLFIESDFSVLKRSSIILTVLIVEVLSRASVGVKTNRRRPPFSKISISFIRPKNSSPAIFLTTESLIKMASKSFT